LQEDPEVWLLKCGRCAAASASHLPTKEALDRYYAHYYQANAAQRVTLQGLSRFSRRIVKRAFPYPPSAPLDVLDFGGGDGSLAASIAELLIERGCPGVRITVADYNAQLCSPRAPGIRMSGCAGLEQCSGRAYGLVLASAVLEHLPEPRETARRLLTSVRPDGIFYARTPFVAPLFRLLRRAGLKPDFTFPGHIHDLGQDFWDGFIGTLGLPTGEWQILASVPSIVETRFRECFARTALSYVLKAPWSLLGRSWPFVGGWEFLAQRLNRLQ
jgi:SAM-dependent methyltransferase